MTELINVIALVKGPERYIFIYDNESENKILEIFDKYADNKKLSFSHCEAEFLSNRVKSRSLEKGIDFADRLEHIFKKYN